MLKPPPFEHSPGTQKHARATIALCGSIEAEIAQLEAADRPAFLADLGLQRPAGLRLIQTAYKGANLTSWGADQLPDLRAG